MIALYVILGLVLLFVIVILARTIAFKPKKLPEVKAEHVTVNEERAASGLSEMIRCKTVSNPDPSLENEAEFQRFEELIASLFPEVHRVCTLEKPSPRALLFRWRGRSAENPTVLMSHYDVVAADEEAWDKPPFGGIIENGVLWGRGAIDTKVTLNGILQAAESLISGGFVPENDIYFAFGGNEEINGGGAPSIVSLFRERGIKPSLVVDEGGAVISGVFPGVSEPCAVVGIAEKGMLNLEYRVVGGGGHSSAPAPHTPVGKLSRACARLEARPFRYKLTAPTRAMFDTLGRRSTFLYRMIFANLWCFAPLLSLLGKKSGGQMNALMRTTVAFTQMEGSPAMNVIPTEARMVSNSRLIHGDTIDSAVARIKRVIKDDDIELSVISGTNPSVISSVTSPSYRTMEETIRETWNGTVVSPYLMTACSDSRHWGELSDNVYRFSAIAITNEENSRVHGNNERIPVGALAKTVEFYIRLIKKR